MNEIRKRIGILGGAFDPPTNSHVGLADFVLDRGMVDEVWLTPCNNHMYGKEMSPADQRCDMCSLAAKDVPDLSVCAYEIIHGLPGDTWTLIERLRSSPGSDCYDFKVVIGLDNANNIRRWVRWQELIETVPFIVVHRLGEEVDPSMDWYTKPPHVYIPHQGDVPQLSSTMVRDAIRKYPITGGKGMVPDSVFAYIKTHGMYADNFVAKGGEA